MTRRPVYPDVTPCSEQNRSIATCVSHFTLSLRTRCARCSLRHGHGTSENKGRDACSVIRASHSDWGPRSKLLPAHAHAIGSGYLPWNLLPRSTIKTQFQRSVQKTDVLEQRPRRRLDLHTARLGGGSFGEPRQHVCFLVPTQARARVCGDSFSCLLTCHSSSVHASLEKNPHPDAKNTSTFPTSHGIRTQTATTSA